MRCCVLLLWAMSGPLLGAPTDTPQSEEPNSALLVARPSLLDPNFRQTVVLVTQRPDASTVGVILNRPTRLVLADLLPGQRVENYQDAVYFGGPVFRRNVVAVFESAGVPQASAFHLMRGIYMTMQAKNVADLLDRPDARYRLYAGFSGWAPGQLESEFVREGWYVVPASEEIVFRRDTRGMWEEMVARALGRRAALSRPQ